MRCTVHAAINLSRCVYTYIFLERLCCRRYYTEHRTDINGERHFKKKNKDCFQTNFPNKTNWLTVKIIRVLKTTRVVTERRREAFCPRSWRIRERTGSTDGLRRLRRRPTGSDREDDFSKTRSNHDNQAVEEKNGFRSPATTGGDHPAAPKLVIVLVFFLFMVRRTRAHVYIYLLLVTEASEEPRSVRDILRYILLLYIIIIFFIEKRKRWSICVIGKAGGLWRTSAWVPHSGGTKNPEISRCVFFSNDYYCLFLTTRRYHNIITIVDEQCFSVFRLTPVRLIKQ